METLIGDWPFWLNIAVMLVLLCVVPMIVVAAMEPSFPSKKEHVRKKQKLLLASGFIFTIWLYEYILWLLLCCLTSIPDARSGSLAVLIAMIAFVAPILWAKTDNTKSS